MGRWEFIWIALRVIGGYWIGEQLGFYLEFIGRSFLVHLKFVWGSMDVIGESLGNIKLRIYSNIFEVLNTYGSFEAR